MDTGVRNTVEFRTASLAMTFGIVACVALSLAAQKKTSETSGPVVFSQDKGKLTIKLGGQTVGHEEFEIAPSGGGWLDFCGAFSDPPAAGWRDFKFLVADGLSSEFDGELALVLSKEYGAGRLPTLLSGERQRGARR